MIKKIAIGLLAITLAIGAFIVTGPYMRGLKHEQAIYITATPTTYDCADGNCIGFIAEQTSTTGFDAYKGTLLLPYEKGIDKDQLQAKLAQLLHSKPKTICLEGYLHKYPVSTLRLFHSGYGGYRIQLVSFSDKSCDTKSR